MDKREPLYIAAALPGDGWKLKPVANLFMVATNAEKHSYLIWKDGTIQSLPNKPQ
jgi:hypothetical protein